MATENTEGSEEHREGGEGELTALSRRVIGLAIEVHRELGPGMLEATYEECLCAELTDHGIAFQRQLTLPIEYKARVIDRAFRMDIVVAGQLVVEIKAIPALLPVHMAQVLTYLKFGRYPLGLLMNFQAYRLLEGLRRVRP